MKIYKFFIVFAVIFLLCFPSVYAEDLPFVYSENNGEITIDSYTGNDTTVTVPNYIEDMPVKYIGKSAFEGNENIVKVILPRKLSCIYEAAFKDCTKLSSINLQLSIESIADDAFEGCDLLMPSVFQDSYSHNYCVNNNIPFVFAKNSSDAGYLDIVGGGAHSTFEPFSVVELP